MSNRKIITSEQDSTLTYLNKIWQSRELILLFAKRDIQIKYANTFLGVGWTLLQPITGLIIFSVLFHYVLKIQSSGMPYPIYAFLGFSSWTLFSAIFHQGATSVYDHQTLISKVSFPKIIFVLSKVLTGSLDFVISAALLIVLMVFYHQMPGWGILIFPLVFLLNLMIGCAAALWLSSLALQNRDLFHIIPYVSGFGIWLTPVFYSISVFPEKWRFLFYLNPMATAVEAYRWCLSTTYTFDVHLLWNIPFAILLFIGGLLYFGKKEKLFADQL